MCDANDTCQSFTWFMHPTAPKCFLNERNRQLAPAEYTQPCDTYFVYQKEMVYSEKGDSCDP